jgi:hypothetical protein
MCEIDELHRRYDE